MNVLVNLNLNKNELQNVVIQPLAVAPSNPVLGQIYYNTVDKRLYQYDGTSWVGVGSVYVLPEATTTTLGGVIVGDGLSVDGSGEIAVEYGSSTPQKDGTGSAGSADSAARSDHVHPTDTTRAPLASPTFTGTPKAPTAANGTNDTQIATTAFVQNALAYADAMVFKGTIGTGGTVTALPDTHNAGWTYKVITAGTYAGQTCEIGDMIVCVADGTAAANADWTVVQTNVDGAVIGPSGATDGHIPVFDGASGKVIEDGYGVASSVSNDATKIPTNAAVHTALNGLVKTATGTIGTSSTLTSVSFTGTYVCAYATQGGNLVDLDIAVSSNSVAFSVAAAPTAAVTCVVLYI